MIYRSKAVGVCTILASVAVGGAVVAASELNQLSAVAPDVSETLASTSNMLLAVAAISFAGALGTAWVVWRRRTPLEMEILRVITQVAHGDRDVSVAIPRSGAQLEEIGSALNKMVDAVRDNEARLRLVSDNLPGSMLYQVVREPGQNFRFLYVSKGVKELHGVEPTAVLHDPQLIISRVHSEDRLLLEQIWDKSAREFGPVDMVLRMKSPDGSSVVWRHLRSQPRRDSSGRQVWDGIEVDITSSMMTEMENRRLAHIVDMHDNAAIWLNREGRIIYVNQTTCKTSGYTREELIGQPVVLISPTMTPARIDLLWEELRRIGSLMGEGVRRRKDATMFPIEFVTTYVLFNGEEYWCSFARDISERKRAELSLAEASRRLSVALRASRLGVWHYDLRSQCLECDERVAEIYGIPNPSVDRLLALVVEEDRAAVTKDWEEALRRNEPYRHRFRIRRPDGELRHIEVQGTPHRDIEGRWDVIGTTGDVTQAVVAITETERLRAQLLQAQKMETIGQLAAGVTHDFNTLLMCINGFVDLAAMKLGPGHEVSDLLKQARNGAQSAGALVRQILDYSRSSKEQRVLLCLVKTMRAIEPLLEASMPSNVSLELAIECETAPVIADRVQIQQVLMNLSINGAQAIGSVQGTVRIGLSHVEFTDEDAGSIPTGCKVGRYARLTIQDTGCGMDEATRQRIFEPFFTTKKGEGTGLGLSIVHDIVQTHHGGLEVSSQPGVGTVFSVYFPTVSEEADDPMQRALPDVKPDTLCHP